MMAEPKLIKHNLLFRAQNPRDDVTITIPPAVMMFVLGEDNPLGLTDEQREWWNGNTEPVHLWGVQTDTLYDFIALAWSKGIIDPRNRVIRPED